MSSSISLLYLGEIPKKQFLSSTQFSYGFLYLMAWIMIAISMILSSVFVFYFIRDLQKVTISIGFERYFSLWECVFMVNRVLSVFICVSPCPSDHDDFKRFQPMEGIEHNFHIIMLFSDQRIWDTGITLSWRIDEAIQENRWGYWFRSKRISMPWIVTIKHVISCSGSVWNGLQCNRWIASDDLFKEKRHLLTRTESHKKDLRRPRMKWRKASELVCPTTALGSIVLLQSLLKVIFNNMYDVISDSCNILH